MFGGTLRRGRLVAGAVLALLALTAGCGGSDADDPIAAADPTASSPLDLVPSEEPEAPKDEPGEAGAREFARYVAELMFYTLGSGDADTLTSIADETCDVCADYAAPRETRQVSEDALEVGDPSVLDTGDGYVNVTQTIVFPQGLEIDAESGDVVEELQRTTATMVVNLRRDGDRWRLLRVVIKDEVTS